MFRSDRSVRFTAQYAFDRSRIDAVPLGQLWPLKLCDPASGSIDLTLEVFDALFEERAFLHRCPNLFVL